MTDLTSTERFLSHFGHAGLTIKSANGNIGEFAVVLLMTSLLVGSFLSTLPLICYSTQ